VERPGGHRRFLLVVLSIFVCGAFPHQYRRQVEVITAVNIDFSTDAQWHLFRRDHGWDLEFGLAGSPTAAISVDADTA
jgi:hypothetical protein